MSHPDPPKPRRTVSRPVLDLSARNELTLDQYTRLRKMLGTQHVVAAKLGVTREALAKRECGFTELRGEAKLAMRFLVFQTWGCSAGTMLSDELN